MRPSTPISTPAARQLADELADRLTPLGAIEVQRFFGGYALRYAGVQFVMVMKSSVYFHVDDSTRALYQAQQSQPFHYVSKSKDLIIQSYFEVPAAVLESDDQLLLWARASILTLNTNRAANKKKSRRSE